MNSISPESSIKPPKFAQQTRPPQVPPRFASATFHLTARDRSQRLEASSILPELTSAAKPADIAIFNGHRFQTIYGFGGSFTPSSALTWLKLKPRVRDEFIHAYFHPTEGNAYTMGRVAIHSCDFSSGNWTYVEENDVELDSFSIDRDKADVIPLIRAANSVSRSPLRLVASPWSPPGWMKDNGRMCQGGSLLPQHYGTWARYFVKYLQAYASEGLPLWGITTQNETEAVTPWENCTYTSAQELDFVRDHLGPALHEAGLDSVRLYIYDHNRDHIVTHCKALLDDPRAAKFIKGVAYHWYVQNKHDNLRLLHEAWPDKELLFTEGCVELANKAIYEGMDTTLTGFGSNGEAGTNPLEGNWEFGERYARSLIQDFNCWNTGFIDWNLLLDEQGGPNHVNNFCSAPVMADTKNGTLHYQSSYYYIGHFSRFIRPGARRVLCTTAHDALQACAFVNPDDSDVVVILNDQNKSRIISLALDHRTFTLEMPPHSIGTLVTT
jgi:glucosylceramidase